MNRERHRRSVIIHGTRDLHGHSYELIEASSNVKINFPHLSNPNNASYQMTSNDMRLEARPSTLHKASFVDRPKDEDDDGSDQRKNVTVETVFSRMKNKRKEKQLSYVILVSVVRF